MAQENCNFDYVSDLFSQCVEGDPANPAYLRSFLANLQKKYNNNKKGGKLSFFKGLTARMGVKKAVGQKDWDGVIKAALRVLKLNPWNSTCLLQMAGAAQNAGYEEVQEIYLKNAYDSNRKDPEVVKTVARALGERKRFAESIHLWHELEQLKPNDDEAPRMISRLAVEQTIYRSGMDTNDPSKSKFAREGQTQLQSVTVDQANVAGSRQRPSPRNPTTSIRTSSWPRCTSGMKTSPRPKRCSPGPVRCPTTTPGHSSSLKTSNSAA